MNVFCIPVVSYEFWSKVDWETVQLEAEAVLVGQPSTIMPKRMLPRLHVLGVIDLDTLPSTSVSALQYACSGLFIVGLEAVALLDGTVLLELFRLKLPTSMNVQLGISLPRHH